MKPLNNIHFLVISLTDAFDRRAQVEKQFESLGYPFSYLDAVDGRKFDRLPDRYAADARQLRYGYDLSDGEIACFLSHRRAWEYCLTNQINVVIFEDDVVIDKSLLGLLGQISTLKVAFDCLRLSGLTERSISRIKIANLEYWQLVEEMQDPGGAGAYLLKPAGAMKLLDASTKFYEPVDNFIENRARNKLNLISLVPYPVKQNTLPSTIVDRVGFEKSKRHRLRRLFFRTVSDVKRTFWAIGRYLSRKTVESYPD